MEYKFSPSIMCSKPWDVLTYVRQFESCGIDLIHYDVMDGNFVPNIMLGTGEYKDVHEVTDIPLDLHLMCINPDVAVDYFDVKDNDRVCFHPQTIDDPYTLLKKIKSKGAHAGLAFNPKYPLDDIEKFKDQIDFVLLMSVEPGFAGQKILPDAFEKIQKAAKLKDNLKMDLDIMVDGNCNPENVKKMISSGANQFVIGSALLNNNNQANNFTNDYEKYKQEIGID